MAQFEDLGELCKSWEKAGRNEFLKQCRSHVAAASNDGVLSANTQGLRDALYGFIRQCLQGAVQPDVAAAALGEVSHMHAGVSSLIADIFSIVDIETTCLETKPETDAETKSERENMLELLKKCKVFLTEPVLKERMEYETLGEVKIIKKDTFKQKYVRLKTKVFYKQQKFNLLREESEGYSKLGAELAQVNSSQSNHEQLLESIKSLIGCFDLDPNRVLDIILEAFECAPHLDNLFAPLLQNYMCEPMTICHVLGFKFHFFKEENITTPESLHRLAALLLQHELVGLDDLYPHLMPADTDIIQNYKKSITEARQFARKMTIVLLSDREKEEEEAEKEKKENKDDKPADNQKLGLIEAMLRIGDWSHAKQLMDRLPQYCAVANLPVASALCDLVGALIDPLYKQYGMPKGAKSKILTPPAGCKSVTVPTKILDLSPTFRMCNYLGAYAGCQPALLWKLVRLGKVLMSKKASARESEKEQWEEVYRNLLSLIEGSLLPSMSTLDNNACLSEEMWTLLKLMPYNIRYCLYGRWKNNTYAVHPPLIRIKAVITDRAKYIMKRLTKDNVKPLGRQIGKLSHVNPGILFEYVLSTIQRYDNFIGPVVDSLKYLTSLSYDVLAYCVIEALANPEKERMKHDDTNLSLWIQSLASFCGTMFRKYNIELTGLLQYVTNQLKAGKSYDLLILREIIVKMAGIEITEEMTPDQLDALAGGELLRAEGGYFSQVRNTKKSSQRLKDAFLTDHLAVALCMLMSQERFNVVFKSGTDGHVKLLGQLHDQCQDTLVQMGGFLANQLGTEDYTKHLPALSTMVTEYHITPECAFFLYRPMCTHAINSKFDELRKQERSANNSSKLNSQQKMQCYVNAVQAVLASLVESVRALHIPKVWDDISPQFYCTFWTLSMYDLYVPNVSYDKEVNKIRTQVNSFDDMASTKRKKERERHNMIMDKLRDEEKKQAEHCGRVLARLKSECENWFTARSTKNETITQFLQLCIFPRCCFTASDALYCARFVLTVHQLKTQNFSTLLCYDRVFQDITYTLASCTENEASRYGRFLCEMLKTVQRWHSDKSIYEKECGNYPGFVTVLRASGTESSNKADQLDYENFRHVCHKWQYKLTKAVVSCLESKDYTQIRNTLILLTKILVFFPLVLNLSVVLEKRVDKIRTEEKDKRPDLFALAMGYSGLLKGRKPHMIAEDQFHSKDTKSQSASTGTAKKPSAPNQVTPSGNTTASADKADSAAVSGRESSVSSQERTSGTRPSSNHPSASAKKSGSSSNSSSPVVVKSEPRSETKSHQDERKEDKGPREVKVRSEDKGQKDDKSKNHKDKVRRKEEKTPRSEKSSSEEAKKESRKSSSKEIDKTPKSSDEGKHRDNDKDRLEKRAPSSDRGQDKSHKSKRTSAGVEVEAREDKRSSSERLQRGESIASNSSQASSGAGSRRVSPGKEATEREHKRRKVGHQSPTVSHVQEKTKEGERDSHDRSERDRESRRDKDKKTAEKKRDHSEGEREGGHDSKRRKDEESGGRKSSSSPSSREEKDRQKTPKTSSSRPSSSGDAAVNGERSSSAKKDTPKERERDSSKSRKEGRGEDSSTDKVSKRESRGEDGRKEEMRKSKRDNKEEEEDRHHSSSRKRRP
ncbi:THO complex subunit 2-like [Patiria miniata]|uniref:THO complex subunit 2 n=1 Tax=Patiria miniata TaxID=46514 RepID=A0A913ZY72_PATMI|nr:THO complex subunit 2-like [Patiria miniata]